MNWLKRFWTGRRGRKQIVPQAAPAAALTRPAPVLAAATASSPIPTPAPVTTADEPIKEVLPWLLGCAPSTDAAASQTEREALALLDRILALPNVPDNLLPRAAAAIPQLMALIRHTDLPTPEIALRISKDTLLAAEVMRLASSPYYRMQGQVADLEQAIALIGLRGLQAVIARVVLKPIFQGFPGALSERASARLWEHSDALARHAAALAEQAGQPVFDGFLAGMLHDTGWTVAFHVIDRAGLVIALPASGAFAKAMDDRVHRLFGHAAQRWDITPGFKAFASDARLHGIAGGAHPLAGVLQQAHRLCMADMASAATAS